MNNPEFNVRLIRLLFVGWTAMAVTALAQPPDAGSVRRASRTRPQIIYHLPPASNYAATLHSQAKAQNNELPNESMPIPPQNSHPNVNVQQQQGPPTDLQVNPKPKANHGHSRSFAKPSSHGNPHGNKSHKK